MNSMAFRLPRLLSGAVLAATFGLGTLPAGAASGAPLPRCSADTQSFYLMRYMEATTANTPPRTILDLAAAPATGAVTLTNIWDGATAPVASPLWDPSGNAGATVAGGMGKDGYIYALRAVGTKEAPWTVPGKTWGPPDQIWRTHTRYYEMLRYGRDGVDNLGVVDGLGTYVALNADGSTGAIITGADDARLGPNFNAADIDPVTGIMYVARFQTGGKLNQLYKIDVTQTPPKYIGTLNLSADIPGAQSGDFAIDASGQYAYGVAKAAGIAGNSTSYRINLASGVVENLVTNLGIFPFGAAARLPNDPTKMAFYGTSTRIMSLPGGTLATSQATASSDSSDGAACLPKLKATLQCTPAVLVDADANVATCTVTLNEPAPAGGLLVGLTPPAGNARYSTSCGSSMSIAAGATTAQCTITATPNALPGDGDVTAAIALSAPAALDDYELATPSSASVLIQDDDPYVATLMCDPATLFDSAGNTSTCTVGLNGPAPTGGMTVALTPPASHARYETTCGTSVSIAQGATSTTCTITATPNTVVGDGDVSAVLALGAPPSGAGYQVGSPNTATVAVRNDDQALPVASLNCTPAQLTDSDNQVATCTITLDGPAPAGGLALQMGVPAASSRYSTSCASPMLVAAGASTASCTVTATANTTPGDGDVVASLSLLPGTGYALGTAAAQVTVKDDDRAGALAPIPTLSPWLLTLLSAGLGVLAWRRKSS